MGRQSNENLASLRHVTHGHHNQLKIPPGIDMVIHSGDATNTSDSVLNLKELNIFFEWFKSLDIRYKIFVAGNHDVSIERGLVNRQVFKDNGIIYLENNSTVIESLTISGSPITPTFGTGWAFNKPRHKTHRIWDNLIFKNTDIFVCHSPPKGVLDVVDKPDRTLEHCGDKSLMDRIKKTEPKAVLFGHIHNNGENINAGTFKSSNLRTLFSNGSVVTDRRFGKITSNGNTLKL